MEFPHIGRNCSYNSCNKLDFLPMKCDACREVYCTDHFTYIKHECTASNARDVQVPECPLCGSPVPGKRNEPPDVAVSAHIDNQCMSDPAKERRKKVFTNKCSHKGCKTKELVPLVCAECSLNYCLRHRHMVDHACDGKLGAKKRQAATTPTATMAQRSADARAEYARGTCGNAVKIEDLLPTHLKTEIRSTNMGMISRASLRDSQEIGADKKITVALDKIEREEIVIRCFSSNTYSSYNHTLLICNTIHEIFVGESTSDTDSVRIFLQALVLIFGKGVLNAIRADLILENAGLFLTLDELDPNDRQAMDDLMNDPETQLCMEKLRVADLPNPRIVTMAYCGAILLLAGKQLTEASVTAWTGRRVRGLSASMGTSIEITSVTPFNLLSATRIYQKLSMLVPLRAAMVRLLFGTTGTGSHVAALSAAMLNLLAWAEMNHIRMIQDYIFGRFPELLAMKQLQGSSIGVLQTAWDYLNDLDERERPYAKLLYSSQHTKALQRDHFVLLTDAAHAVGTYLHSSLAHYQGDTQGTAGTGIKKIVREYLMNLERTGHLVVQAPQYTTLDSRLVDNIPRADMLFKQQLDDLDLEVKALVRE